MLISLMYYSSISPGVTAEEIALIFKTAQRKNADMAISRVLYSDGKKFIQVLEGQRSDVSQVFAAIQKDPRHHDIIVVTCVETMEREYGEWSMGLLKPDPAVKEILKEDTGSEVLEPWRMDYSQLKGLLKRLADGRLRQIVPHFGVPV